MIYLVEVDTCDIYSYKMWEFKR